MKTQTLVAYYFAVPEDGGYMEVIREDFSNMRANTKKELIEADLEEAKEYAASTGRKLFIVKEELTAEEVA